MTNALIIFAKNPVIGKIKTRIGNKLGDEVALAIYYQLIHKAQQITSQLPCDKFVYYSDFIDKEDSWDSDIYSKRKQINDDLGHRMSAALKECFYDGYDKVILIGTDIYELSSEIIEDAFERLNTDDAVIGPAKDGGYYLIGMKAPHEDIFNISQWSTPSVFDETISHINKAELKWSQTQVLNDIDEPEDLEGTDLIKLINR